MSSLIKLISRLQGRVEAFFPGWTHQRHRQKWESHWADPTYNPFWKTERPQKELVEAVASGWFDRHNRIVDIGCGNGEVSRWLAAEGYRVTGLDYSAAAIENCRRLSAAQQDAPTYDVADLCDPHLELEPAASLFDRGCFHRIADHSRPLFARNLARAALPDAHFLLLAGTFDDPRFANYRGARAPSVLQDHIEAVFGSYFLLERAESAVINANETQEAMPAVAFWMIRRTD